MNRNQFGKVKSVGLDGGNWRGAPKNITRDDGGQENGE
jgi:hypothetical protein